jgi:aspartyl-tRNA(Asn)/glutamyl-tRNA(Gln) amidotransferase subunit A
LGTDTLASIRLPAAYCGVVGFKPTHGLSSIRGIIPVAGSLDHAGPLTRTVIDTALVLQAIAGFDSRDPMSLHATLPAYASAALQSPAKLRLGIPRTPYYEDLHADVASAIEVALGVLGDLTAGTREVSLPALPDFRVLLAEGYSYHERFLKDPANHARYDPVTLTRLLAAGEVSAATYIRVRDELALVRRAIAEVFTEVDLLVTPTAPGLPETIANAENPAEASGAEPSVRNTAPFNLYGIPTLSVPCGFSQSGLPIALQISGPRLGELPVIALAHAYEQATTWHTRTPPSP